MFNPGDGTILLGDSTSHGGTVVTAQASYLVNGTPVAVVGDMVACPQKGHGVCPIVEGHPTFTVNGKSVAFHGCHTACGATLLSSMNGVHALGDNRQPSAQALYDSAVAQRRQYSGAGIRHSFANTEPAEAPCNHPDQALDLAAFIVGEIQRNVVSRPGRMMSLWNGQSSELSIEVLTQEMDSMGGDYPTLASIRNFLMPKVPSRVCALVLWAWMVRENGDWDHKHLILQDRDFDSLGKSSYRYHHKYGEYEYYYDIWANIHYGYVSLYCGFSEGRMLDGAGLEQIGSDTLHDDQEITYRSETPGRWPSLRKFDDVTDNLSIRLGFELYHEYPDPSALTADIVMQKVASAPYPIRQGAKVRHDCALARSRRI
ncbi:MULTISPECIES: PAAR domain-containing protein [Halomonas]|uniref:PAAR domain-containing protein n=1 Tax=Halomonas TaxID=2745 RepID=UPI001C98527F|nr:MULTISPECIES: PAAR domain-containing protein [Halomonas]MBY6207941.1 PAAR domain-containing protein [Halomonas sp. DP3Y7-2]MBY6228750.1 PAAR domain-containing protein [Halomonas sp. DP3Y7-1]MCA0917266.1 PAAR domain-containing protein [Halomonas denitrificans]